MQRLAALVPRPRLHLIRFYGVLSPNAKLRPLVVPQGPPVLSEPATEAAVAAECEVETVQARPHRIGWARLLKRVVDIDMQHCPNCGGWQLKIIAAMLKRPVIEKVLTHLGLDPQPPSRGRTREVGQVRRHLSRASRHQHHIRRLSLRNAAGAALRTESARRHRKRVNPESDVARERHER